MHTFHTFVSGNTCWWYTQWHARTVIYTSNYIYTVVTVIYQVIYQIYVNSQSVINTFTTRTILQLCKNIIWSKIKIPTSIVRIRKENNPMLPFAKKASFNKNLTVYQRYVGAYIDSTDTKTYITSGTRALCFLRKQAVSLSLFLSPYRILMRVVVCWRNVSRFFFCQIPTVQSVLHMMKVNTRCLTVCLR